MQNFYMSVYGLQDLPVQPQFVLPGPPSAFTTVGVTKVLRNTTAVARNSNARFIMVFSLELGLDGDGFMLPALLQQVRRTGNCPEFVTR